MAQCAGRKTALQAREPQAERILRRRTAVPRALPRAARHRGAGADQPRRRHAGKPCWAERNRPLRLAREAGGNPEVIVRQQGEAEIQRSALRLELASWKASSANGGRHRPPRRRPTRRTRRHRYFRRALEDAGIAHALLAELVEITETGWQTAVEALFAPSPISSCWLANGTPKRPLRWAKSTATATSSSPNAAAGAPGTVLSRRVVNLRRPVPDWIDTLLDRTRRVEDLHAGARLPRGQDWVTRRATCGSGAAAVSPPRNCPFGAARLAALRQNSPNSTRASPGTNRHRRMERRIATCAPALPVNRRPKLAARADEFARAEREISQPG